MLPRASDLRYNWVVVRLEAVDADELRDLVLDAWSMAVPRWRRSTAAAARSAPRKPRNTLLRGLLEESGEHVVVARRPRMLWPPPAGRRARRQARARARRRRRRRPGGARPRRRAWRTAPPGAPSPGSGEPRRALGHRRAGTLLEHVGEAAGQGDAPTVRGIRARTPRACGPGRGATRPHVRVDDGIAQRRAERRRLADERSRRRPRASRRLRRRSVRRDGRPARTAEPAARRPVRRSRSRPPARAAGSRSG